ncbi:MAG TPA: D-alanyl-D-alanine carboxypeptidase/D-alanyl-D-alanine-endopeptidase [Capsulimonadaceae bacterium]|jgi:D-alanyl-D-alanine carboxypeptidase/D-alanyl-D-alanine-endopeptidase (penicillin-binding protein 4)
MHNITLLGKRIATLLCGGLLAVALAQPAQAGTLAQDIGVLLHMRELHGSIVGIAVTDVRTRKILYLNNADTRLVPASNRKLFTAATALHYLGDRYRMHTTLLADESPTGDTLKGNVYLRGGGDALLTIADIRAMAKQLTDAGVRHITGDIVGDASIFSDGPYPAGWSWDYLADDYAAQIAGLEVEQGLTQVTVLPGKALGDKPLVKLFPASGYLPVNNQAVTVAAGEPLTLKMTRPYNKNVLQVSGNVPLDFRAAKSTGVTVDNPPLYATTLLTEELLSNGVTIDGATRLDVTPKAAVTIADHESVPLAEYLPLMLKPSNNLVAESLIRLVGYEKGGDGSYAAGYAAEQKFLTELGFSTPSYSFADGSGVSRLNAVTPFAILKILSYEAMQPNFKVFYDALPIAGVDGTLRKRMKGTDAEGNAHAKTGTVRFCHTLSGYVSDQDANILAFTIMNNNYSVDSQAINVFQDAVVARLAQEHSIGIVAVPAPKPVTKPVVTKPVPVAKPASAAPAQVKPGVAPPTVPATPAEPKPTEAPAESTPVPTAAPPVSVPAPVKPANEPAATHNVPAGTKVLSPTRITPVAPLDNGVVKPINDRATAVPAAPAKKAAAVPNPPAASASGLVVAPTELEAPAVAPIEPSPVATPVTADEAEPAKPAKATIAPAKPTAVSSVAHSSESLSPATKSAPKPQPKPAPLAPPVLAKPASVLGKPSQDKPTADAPKSSEPSRDSISPSPVAVPATADDDKGAG